MLLFTLTGTFASAATLSTTIRLATYAVTCAALPALRRDGRREQAPFTVPGGNLVAAVALLLIAWLFASSTWPDARAALVAAAIGLLLYAFFARRATRLRVERLNSIVREWCSVFPSGS